MATEAAPGAAAPSPAGRLAARLAEPVPIAPLAAFRILFGLVMSAAAVRFWSKGWIDSLYVEPAFHFTYRGFGWVRPLGEVGTHLLFLAIGLSALGILLGWRYRLSAWTFFLSFTYAELLDKTTYLNHYYFVSLAAFLLLWVPAADAWSLDARRRGFRRESAARWNIGVFKAQIGMVYFFAGLAKLNADWLLLAQPLSLWLPAKSHLPVIGPLLDVRATAYLFSWAGAAFDLSIAFLLLWRRTLPLAYASVVVFHGLTGWLFPSIGVFPYVMMLGATVFLPASLHARALEGTASALRRLRPARAGVPAPRAVAAAPRPAAAAFHPSAPAVSAHRPIPLLLVLFFAVQILWPMRHLVHGGHLFWTEAGYRFSWRVMLMEKAGHATFYVTDPATGGRSEVPTCDYLTPFQEKMMATQPDMILDFAQHLAADYAHKGMVSPEVRVHSYVTLNGRGSRLYVDSTVNLAALPPGAAPESVLRPWPYDL